LTKGLDKRIQEHNRQFHQNIALHNQDSQTHINPLQSMAQSLQNIGLGFAPSDHFLLLSTGQQHHQNKQSQMHMHSICGAGGRLLVGYGSGENSFGGDSNSGNSNTNSTVGGINSKNSNAQDQQSKQMFLHGHAHHGVFEQELKKIRANKFPSSTRNELQSPHPSASAVGGQTPSQANKQHFPENGGGARGLNIALSSGFQLLSRHRLRYRSTENFGMGRLPSSAMLSPASSHNKSGSMNNGGMDGNISTPSNALQPACLILLTDGECLTRPKAEGGGSLQLQFGNMPLREFYSEPFRWDHRFFCVNIGKSSSSNPEQPNSLIHPSLNALCEVTGGGHINIYSSSSLSQTTDRLLRMIAPSRPSSMPIPDPLRLPSLPPLPPPPTPNQAFSKSAGNFVNGGPVCTFQSIERVLNGESHRALLLPILYQRPVPPTSLFVSSSATVNIIPSSPPIWCIPENFFPSKKLETLPPRTAQPLLSYTRMFQYPGLNVFDPMVVMKFLHRLDHLTMINKQMQAIIKQKTEKQPTQTFVPSVQLLQRDVYVCHWIGKDGKGGVPHAQGNLEHFPVSVRGAVRPSLTDGEDTFLNIGILHIPISRAGKDSNTPQLSTLTMLPPEPQILLPL